MKKEELCFDEIFCKRNSVSSTAAKKSNKKHDYRVYRFLLRTLPAHFNIEDAG